MIPVSPARHSLNIASVFLWEKSAVSGFWMLLLNERLTVHLEVASILKGQSQLSSKACLSNCFLKAFFLQLICIASKPRKELSSSLCHNRKNVFQMEKLTHKTEKLFENEFKVLKFS